jgi:hypothetical protein
MVDSLLQIFASNIGMPLSKKIEIKNILSNPFRSHKFIRLHVIYIPSWFYNKTYLQLSPTTSIWVNNRPLTTVSNVRGM